MFGLGGLINGAMKLAPGVIKATPGILDGVTGIINAAKGREFEDLSQDEQDLIFGALASLLPMAISAAPGIAQGVSSIIRAAKDQEQDLGFNINVGGKLGPFSGNFGYSREQQQAQEDMIFGALASLLPMAISAAPGIAQGVAGIVNAAKGRQEEDLGWGRIART